MSYNQQTTVGVAISSFPNTQSLLFWVVSALVPAIL